MLKATTYLKGRLEFYKNAHLLRTRRTVDPLENSYIMLDGKKLLDFSSNDYLGLKKHPKVIECASKALNEYGIGSGASAFVSGYSKEHEKTEEMFASWLKVDKALLFPSGYSANCGIFGVLVKRSDTVFSDKLCHASILDGISLSRAKHFRYKHNDVNHLKAMSKKMSPTLTITESIFSMEGDITPLSELVKTTKETGSGLIIDDAHGIGILGRSGKGAIEHFSLTQEDFSCLVLPLGKAFNACGAIVAGKMEVIEAVTQFSKSYKYTTALPPVICAALQASLKVLQEESHRREHLKEICEFFNQYAAYKGITLISKELTPIRMVPVQTIQKLLKVQDSLEKNGFYVPAIRPPTVPKNQARLRISLNTLHTKNQIEQLLNLLSKEI
ncbi:MAG TPA: 8-amino-7-oxononanoate synthase [Alphaproteobacteria bacterium]|nr:8-amino-7-oxononanoate synthase [Alphaproteobacteria bacterium]